MTKDTRPSITGPAAAHLNMRPEFDTYASDYSSLLADPVRDRFASDSNFFHQRKWAVIRNFLRTRGVDSSKMNWLDVGCGQGELLRLAHGDFALATGCDPSAGMIAACESVEVHRQSSMTDLPFPAQSFDLVTTVCVYHHVPVSKRALLTESIQRTLKPGGLFCVIEHNPWNPITRSIVKRCPVDKEASLLTPSDVGRLAKRADLQVLETTYFLYLPEAIFRRVAWIEEALGGFPMGGQFAVFSAKSFRDSYGAFDFANASD
jgi:SAM-dependent methyltransferase